MKASNGILILILIFLIIFSFLIVMLTNWNLRRMYTSSSQNTFYLLSFIIDHYLEHEISYEEVRIDELRKKSSEIKNNLEILNESFLTESIQGIWIFKNNLEKGITNYRGIEKEILRFYEQNMKGKDSHSLIFIKGQPFFLSHFQTDSLSVLILSKTEEDSGIRINQILDSLVTSSNLIYFSILDEAETPIIFSSLYENFLPLQGEGSHVIKTPVGKIFHIEEKDSGKRFVVGFSMNDLDRITSINIAFLIFVIFVFVVLEAVFLFNIVKFERFKVVKEKEINHFREIGALSTGFTHEFRNSLNSLSLLSKDLDEEERDILTEEIERMKTVMDSLKFSGMQVVKKEELEVGSLVDETISLLQNSISENNVIISKEIHDAVKCFGNRTLLITVFSNLIKNSIEAGASHIILTAHKKGNNCQIDFIDDGKGIEIKPINKIFEPFYTKKNQTGLGLYLAKKIIDMHEGEIKVLINSNTIFTIILKA